jgi:hypothetical protein
MSTTGGSTDADALYALLPAFVRLRDQTQGGGALQALVGVIAEQAQVVSASLDQLYDDQFIETCAPWVVPYIGDLIGFTPLRPLGPGQPSATRAEVADTIGYRRRKGTLAMLEQLCSDVTGWPGMAVEYFTRLSTTQYVRNHLRLDNTIVDVHSPMTAFDAGSAFDLPPRSVDVRRIDSGRGRYNIPNIGLFVWRLAPYANFGHQAFAVGPNRYTFDPFGGDVPLVNLPAVTASTFALTGRVNLPFFLQRYPLHCNEQPYAAPAPQPPPPPLPALPPPPPAPGPTQPPVGIAVNGTAEATILWCDLSSWAPPTAAGSVAVDPVLGRLVFATVTAPAATDPVTVNYTYAFSGDYGGGAYDQPVPATEAQLTATEVTAADLPTATGQVIEITDSGIYLGDLDLPPADGSLVVRAGPLQRPVVTGDLTIDATADASNATAEPSVTLRGLGIGGSLIILGTSPLTVRLEHCTVRGGITWSSAAVSGTLVIDHSLCGAIEVNPDLDVTICDSAVDAGSDTAPALSAGAGAPAGSITIARSTILGTVAARTIPKLENSIVTGSVVSTERQAGCLRYSFVPLAGSQTPQRFRCQPDLEINTEVAAARAANPGLTTAQLTAIQTSVPDWLLPAFTSRTPGQPGYLQLADAAPDQIRFGADEEDEMGVFYGLFSARRESNLSYRLNEYLRIRLEAGIIHAT